VKKCQLAGCENEQGEDMVFTFVEYFEGKGITLAICKEHYRMIKTTQFTLSLEEE
jgi:hypothetical protein